MRAPATRLLRRSALRPVFSGQREVIKARGSARSMAPPWGWTMLLLLLALNHLASPVRAQIIPITNCQPDFLEPNDDFQNSTYVALPVMAPALTLCPAGDRDFFRFKLTEETKLTFAINCNTPELKVRFAL